MGSRGSPKFRPAALRGNLRSTKATPPWVAPQAKALQTPVEKGSSPGGVLYFS